MYIVYGPGDIVIGSDISSLGYIFIYSKDEINNYSKNLQINDIHYSNSKAPVFELSMTVIPNFKSSFEKMFLGYNVDSIRVATDSEGHLYYTYFVDSSLELHLVTNASGEWVDEVIIIENNGIGFLNLVVDKFNNIHICYSPVVYGTNASGEWVFETIDDNSYLPSLAIDSLGYAHIAYVNFADYPIFSFYATNKSGSWKRQLVQIAPFPPYPYMSQFGRPAIAIDSNDDPYYCNTNYIGYNGFTYETITYYGTLENNRWVMKSILKYYSEQGDPHIFIDSKDALHLIYYIWINNNSQINHTYYKSGYYITEPVSNQYYGYQIAATLDNNDNLHVVFVSPYDYILFYSTNETGEWVTTMLGGP